MGVQLNRQGLADHMGVSVPTVDRFVKEGCPIVQRGGRGVEHVFDLADLIKWYAERRANAVSAQGVMGDLETEKTRLVKAQADKAEIDLAKTRGELASIQDFERAEATVFAQIRQNVLNVPQRVVTQLIGETCERTFKEKLRAELCLALEASATSEIDINGDYIEDDE